MSELKINQLSPLSGGSITTTAPISCSVMPTTADQLANKMYVDSLFRQSGAGVSKDYVDNQDIRYYNQVGENFVRKSGNVNEVVTGTKAFATPPTCNTMCEVENELANKQYVDERSLQTYVNAQNYADSLLGSQGAATPITAIDLPQMPWIDASGQSRTGYSMAGSSDARPEIIGANGIVVSGETGEYPPATGQSGPQRFNRIIIDGGMGKQRMVGAASTITFAPFTYTMTNYVGVGAAANSKRHRFYMPSFGVNLEGPSGGSALDFNNPSTYASATLPPGTWHICCQVLTSNSPGSGEASDDNKYSFMWTFVGEVVSTVSNPKNVVTWLKTEADPSGQWNFGSYTTDGSGGITNYFGHLCGSGYAIKIS